MFDFSNATILTAIIAILAGILLGAVVAPPIRSRQRRKIRQETLQKISDENKARLALIHTRSTLETRLANLTAPTVRHLIEAQIKKIDGQLNDGSGLTDTVRLNPNTRLLELSETGVLELA